MTSRLAIDVMSGDYGSSVIIEGLVEAIRIYPEPFIVHLCGNKEKIRTDLKNAGIDEKDYGERFILEHCTDVIDSHDSPARAWKKKSNSSIVKCIVLQDEGVVDASMSAGDTGMLMGAAIFILGRLKGIGRPALAAFLPNAKKRSSLILDVGANLNCRPGHLVNFGLLGYRYIKKFLDMPYPKVALLNIGEEPYKGTKNIYEADKELRRSCSGYTGFIEGSGVLLGEADVIVCDGFVGNVLLKACESMHVLAKTFLGQDQKAMDTIKGNMEILNPENYGAVPLLGIKGIVLKAHGCSSAKAISNAIITALTAIKKNIVPSTAD
ncbi:MAG TPA: phosphate acyltransferase PlsX [Fibrobacteres bacterium]|jgi:phosphate acyltransferase|nr:phosphate acyltransferase PlsX [Fibrobacterota bacterium]